MGSPLINDLTKLSEGFWAGKKKAEKAASNAANKYASGSNKVADAITHYVTGLHTLPQGGKGKKNSWPNHILPKQYGPTPYQLQHSKQNYGVTPKQIETLKQQARADAKYGAKKTVALGNGKIVSAGSAEAATATGTPLTPAQKKAIRMERKYGKTPKSGGKATPAPKPVDEIANQIAAMLQQSGRLTDFYTGQTKTIQDDTIKNALALQANQNALLSPIGAAYTGTPGQMTADQYAASMANSSLAKNNADISGVSADVGGRASALNAYYGGARDLANQQHKTYGITLKQMEPKMRAEKAAAEAEAAMKQAEQDYLNSKLSVDAQYKSGQLALGQSRLNEQIRNNNLVSSDKAAGRALSASEKNVKNALAGMKIGAARQKLINSWVKDNLYQTGSTSNTVTNPDGSKTTTGGSGKTKRETPYTDVFSGMTGAGFSKDEALRVAINHNPGSVKKVGAPAFYTELVNSFGVSPRQSIKYIEMVFGKKVANHIKKHKNTLISDEFAKTGNLISGALG